MKKAFISIIVPIYNSEKYLKICIESILNQTYKDFELLLINDGSTDSSNIICDNYSMIDNRVKAFHKKNEGASNARKFGINQAKGDFLLFVDSDDYIASNAAETLISALDINTDIAVSNLYVVGKRKRNFIHQNFKYGYGRINQISALLSGSILGALHGKLVRKELFEGIEIREDLKVGEDAVITYQLFSKTENVKIIDDKLYFYVQHSGSVMHQRSLNLMRCRLEYMKWILNFIRSQKNTCLEFEYNQLIHCLAIFMNNEYYVFLRDGGSKNLDPEFSEILYSDFLRNLRYACDVPKWRKLLIKLHDIKPVLSSIYLSIFLKVRVLLDQ